GDDEIDGSNGNDTIYGGDGNDHLQNGLGDDTVHGGNGDDFLEGTLVSGRNWLYGDAGNDSITVNDTKEALADHTIDGCTGFGTLEITPADVGMTFDHLGALAATVHNIEAIGLRYASGTTLSIDPKDVLDFSPSHELVITGGLDSFWGSAATNL